MADSNMVPMLAPDGSAAMVPADQVQTAIKKGARPGVHMLCPDGSQAVVPKESAAAALQAGARALNPGDLAALSVPKPVPGELSGEPSKPLAKPSILGLMGSPLRYSAANPDIAEADSNVVTGGVKGAGSTAYNLANLATVGKVLPPRPDVLKPSNQGEELGYGAEQLAEFAAPMGAIGKLGKTAEAAAKARTGLKVAGTAARALTEGAGLGAIEAAHGGDVKDVAATSALGAAGPIMEEGVGAAAKALAKTEPVQALMKAIRPSAGKVIGLDQNLAAALPDVLAAEKTSGVPVTNMDVLLGHVQAAKKQVWKDLEAKLADAGKAGAVIEHDAPNAALAALENPTTPIKTGARREVEKLAKFYDRPMTPSEAQEAISDLNAELQGLYRKDSQGAAAALASSPVVRAKKNVADALRQSLDETLSGSDSAALRQRYGSLNVVEDALEARIANTAAQELRVPTGSRMGERAALGAAGGALYNARSGDPGQIAEGALVGGLTGGAAGLAEAKIGNFFKNKGGSDAIIRQVFEGLRNPSSGILSPALRGASKLAVPAARTGAAANSILDEYRKRHENNF